MSNIDVGFAVCTGQLEAETLGPECLSGPSLKALHADL